MPLSRKSPRSSSKRSNAVAMVRSMTPDNAEAK
jgi:hypothetical protein